jgi:hypothetical protein
MLKSKRFLALIASGIIFVTGTFFFKVDPVNLATGIGIILAPYLAAETYSKSKIE